MIEYLESVEHDYNELIFGGKPKIEVVVSDELASGVAVLPNRE